MFDFKEDFLNSIRFKAEVRPIYDQAGNEIPAEIGRGIYRADTDQILSTCGARYEPIQHTDVLDPVLQTMHDQGYEIIERAASRHDLYDLKGSKGAFVNATLSGHGARLAATIITGDFIDPVTQYQADADGQNAPTMFREFSIFNSHDTSLAARVDPGYKVLRCMNGMRSPVFSASVRSKHMSGFNVAAFKAQVLASAELMANDIPRFEAYATTPLTKDQAERFLKETLARQPDINEKPQFSAKLVDTIMHQWTQNEAHTVWGMLMALTWWATHYDVRTGKSGSDMMSRIRRDEEVSLAMRSERGRELLGIA